MDGEALAITTAAALANMSNSQAQGREEDRDYELAMEGGTVHAASTHVPTWAHHSFCPWEARGRLNIVHASFKAIKI